MLFSPVLYIAFPPLESSIAPFMQLNSEEQTLLGIVTRQHYWTSTGIINPPEALGYNAYYEVINKLPLEPVANFPYVFYSPWKEAYRHVVFAGSKTKIDEEIIRENALNNIIHIAETRGFPKAEFMIDEKFTDWIYFPHVSS